MVSRSNKILGDWGETEACKFLGRQGFEILDRNFYTTVGEIDIVARHRGDFYFIEVKTRVTGELANDLSITGLKKRHFAKAVSTYCYRRNIKDVGIVMAGLVVFANRITKQVKFRLAVFC